MDALAFQHLKAPTLQQLAWSTEQAQCSSIRLFGEDNQPLVRADVELPFPRASLHIEAEDVSARQPFEARPSPPLGCGRTRKRGWPWRGSISPYALAFGAH